MRLLGIAANVVAIVACGVVLVQVAQRDGPDRTARPPAGAASPGFAVGDTVDLSGVDLAGAAQAVLLVLSSRCGYCGASLPFYRGLTTGLRTNRRDIAAVAMCREPVDTCTAFLKGGGVDVDQVLDTRGRPIRVSGTPTLLIVRPGGTITGIWTGRLDERQETEVLRVLDIAR
jgi:hypothetical protein